MKHLILTTALCLSLTACETVSGISWPSFGFGDDVVETVEIDAPEMPTAPVAVVNQSAINTELDEMEKLTGTRMQVQNFISQPDEAIIEPIQIAEAPVEAVIEETIIEDAQIVEQKPEMVIEEKAPEIAIVAPKQTTGCPKIEIVPATKSITKFDVKNPTQMMSRASIMDVRGGCEVVKGGMEIDLDILMRGTITTKGRFDGNRNEEAFMTFPYFVSVMAPDGNVANKKIMATAMRFRPSVDYVDHAEKITQFVPMNDVNNSSDYTITVGYQLTRTQLGYNKMEIDARPNDGRASPDTSKAKRRSYNPLASE